jgi:DNA-binding response OmpR family regulator
LIAEDNPPDVFLLREALRAQKLACEVRVATDGEEAMSYIAVSDTDDKPDLFILDLNLPKKDGFEVLRWLRTSGKYSGVPVIVVTSSNAPVDRSEAERLGAAYFRKPANYDDFLKVGLILRKLLRVEPA